MVTYFIDLDCDDKIVDIEKYISIIHSDMVIFLGDI